MIKVFEFDVVVGFGGYLMFLLMFVVWFVSVLFILYEVNVVMGWVNKMLVKGVIVIVISVLIDGFLVDLVVKVVVMGNFVCDGVIVVVELLY